jgi:TrpR-related protein YerC/YecD
VKFPKVKEKHLTQLYKAILALESEEECRNFFYDLCTITEVHSLAQRLEVARLLESGATYQSIEQSIGASTATISRVKRFLYYGAGGYQSVLQRLSEAEKEDDQKV